MPALSSANEAVCLTPSLHGVTMLNQNGIGVEQAEELAERLAGSPSTLRSPDAIASSMVVVFNWMLSSVFLLNVRVASGVVDEVRAVVQRAVLDHEAVLLIEVGEVDVEPDLLALRPRAR